MKAQTKQRHIIHKMLQRENSDGERCPLIHLKVGEMVEVVVVAFLFLEPSNGNPADSCASLRIAEGQQFVKYSQPCGINKQAAFKVT